MTLAERGFTSHGWLVECRSHHSEIILLQAYLDFSYAWPSEQNRLTFVSFVNKSNCKLPFDALIFYSIYTHLNFIHLVLRTLISQHLLRLLIDMKIRREQKGICKNPCDRTCKTGSAETKQRHKKEADQGSRRHLTHTC